MTLALVTALFFSCAVPTLAFGRAATAAMPVPLRATSSAIHATTIAGEGRRRRSVRIGTSMTVGLRSTVATAPDRVLNPDRILASGAVGDCLVRRRSKVSPSGGDGDDHGLEVLTATATGAAVDVPLEPVDDPQPGPVEHLAVEVAAVVDDDADRRPVAKRAASIA